MKQATKIVSLLAFPILVFLAHLIAVTWLDLYRLFPKVDIPFHFIGGFSIAFATTKLMAYLESEKVTPPLNRVILLVLLLSLTATATVYWEFMEFVSDRWLHTHLQPSLANTMQDQFVGVLGGSTWVFIYMKTCLLARPR